METNETKRGRGRPKKNPTPESTPVPATESEPKRGRGRPRLSEEEKEERALMRKTGELPIQRRNRPDLAKYGQEYVEPGDNSRYLAHALATMSLPKIDIADPEQVQERINWYFTHCLENDMKPTVKGFCNALGIVRQTLLNWRTGVYRSGTHEEMIVKAYNVFEEMWENYMQNGKINPMAGVFLGCNNFGYKDVKQLNVTPVVNNEPETIDVSEIEAKYADLPED